MLFAYSLLLDPLHASYISNFFYRFDLDSSVDCSVPSISVISSQIPPAFLLESGINRNHQLFHRLSVFPSHVHMSHKLASQSRHTQLSVIIFRQKVEVEAGGRKLSRVMLAALRSWRRRHSCVDDAAATTTTTRDDDNDEDDEASSMCTQ